MDSLGAKYLNRTQAADVIGVSPSFLAHRAGTAGGPPMLRIGRRAIYRLDLLQQWADGHLVIPKRARGRPRKGT